MSTLEAFNVVAPALTTSAGFRLEARAPRIVGDGTRLQFDLALQSSGGEELLVLKGFSIYEGLVQAPARPQGRAWIKMAVFGSPEAEQYLRTLLEPWRLLYPDVNFGICE